MTRRKLFIAGAITLVAIIVVVVVVVIVGGVWLMRSRSKAATPVRTAVGTPKGPPTAKIIGPVGGSILSADGRITLEVPPNAVSESVNFSIQPITNMAPGGIGYAYRLEPSGANFSSPVKISFKFTEEQLGGSTPEVLSVAYQDNAGVWQSLTGREIDKEKETYTVPTTHFTDISFAFNGAFIAPEVQTVRLGETATLQLLGCPYHPESDFDKIKRYFGGTTEELCYGSVLFDGHTLAWYVPLDWSVDYGTIETGKRTVVYTAPSTRPPLGYAWAKLHPLEETTDGSAAQGFPILAMIRIDAGYKAYGTNGAVEYSGTVCDLGKPFHIKATMAGMMTLDIEFHPNNTGMYPHPSILKGKFGYSTVTGALHMSGLGEYEVKNYGKQNIEIVCHEESEAHGPRGIGSSGKGLGTIELKALDTNECSGK